MKTQEENISTPENSSFENEANIDSSVNETLFEFDSLDQVTSEEENIIHSEKEHTPKLFSEDSTSGENNTASLESEQKLFDQENNQEEDFEIPAFLRRQKF